VFDHEKLEVYRIAIEMVGVTDRIVEQLPRGRGKLADQLSRAAISVPLNIAEGAGLYAPGEKQRAYRISRGSAMECAAIMDVCMVLNPT
jgi:four helix bundle protein